MFNKKGVDAVVATVLIIMITVSAVAVIWAFVVPMIKNSAVSSTAETAKLSIETSGGYTTWDEVQKIARVQIKRGNDNVNLTGLDFNFVKQGNSKKNQTNEVPQPNQIKVYEFNLSDFGKPEKVTVAPITASGVGNVVSQSDVIQNYSSTSIPVQNQVTCVSGLNVDGKIVICNCTDLQNMNQNLGASYILGKDIDCTGISNFDPIGTYPSPRFEGKLDGKDYTISNLSISRQSESLVGIFSAVKNANLSNLIIKNITVLGGETTGGLVGYSYLSTISRVRISGNISGGNPTGVGGLIGQSSSTNISSCSSFVEVHGEYWAGGLVSSTLSSTINNSFSTGKVFGKGHVGGLIGEISSSFVYNSYSTSDVVGGSSTNENDQEIAGLIGRYVTSNISSSFSTGNVSGGYLAVGGLGGWGYDCSFSNLFWYNFSGNPNTCLFYGYVPSVIDCTPKTNIDYFYLKSNTPMSSWDFTNVWQENANNFPTLR